MATLLRIGTRVINIDQVTDIESGDTSVSIYLTSHGINGGPRVVTLQHDQAQKFEEWLDQNATHLTQAPARFRSG